MKRITIMAIFLLLISAVNSQIPFEKYYWGNENLHIVYGISGHPPYNPDTTKIKNYSLPDTITGRKDIFMAGLLKSETDSTLEELAIYYKGKMKGFYMIWDEDGELIRINEMPDGLVCHFAFNKLVEVNYLNDPSNSILRFVDYPQERFKIEIVVDTIIYSFVIDYNGRKIIQEVKQDGDIKYFKLWPSN